MGKGLNELRDEAFRIAKEHGFKDASVGEDIALMHSELSEALEDHRTGRLPHELLWEEAGSGVVCRKRTDTKLDGGEPKPVGIPSELADVIIRILHFSGKHGIDIEGAVREKMLYNETRPHRHGGKKL